MTPVVLVFWVCLLVPGYAIARRLNAEATGSGFLAAVVLSFISAAATLGLLAIPCYYLMMPTWVFSALVVAFVLWGIVDCLLARQLKPIATLLIGAAGLELGLIVLDMILGARVGAILGADATVHVGRIRFLLENGLLNHDQYIRPEYFYPIYHTNILHTLMASAAQLTASDPIDVWFSSLAFVKLLVVSAGWTAGWLIFRNQTAAWVTALFFLGGRGPVTFVLYPNQLAPWVFTTVLLAFVIRAMAQGPSRHDVWMIGATSIVIGMTHSMYAVFAGLSVGVVATVWCVSRCIARGSDARMSLAVVAALAVAVPFPFLTFTGMQQASAERARIDEERFARQTAKSNATENGRTKRTGPELSDRMRRLDNGWVVHKPLRGFNGGRGLRLFVLAMAAALMVMARRRREMIALLATFSVVTGWLLIPPLCTVLFRAGGAEWVVHRFAVLQFVVFAIMVPGSLAAVVARLMERDLEEDRGALTWHVFRVGLGVTCIFAGAHFASLRAPYDWQSYLNRARASAPKRLGRELQPASRLARDLREHVPVGVTVLAEPSIGMRVVMAHDCTIVASASSSTGVPDLGDRSRDIDRMLRGRTPDAERAALLEKYDVEWLVLRRPAKRWTYEQMSEFWTTEYGWCIVRLREPGDASTTVLGDYDQALMDIGEYAQAIPWLRRQVERDRSHFGRHIRLGKALMKNGDYDAAIESYTHAAGLRPRDPRPLIMIGNAHAQRECYDDALDAYERTLDVAMEVERMDAAASAWFNIGNMHYRLGQWQDAIDAYREAGRLNPGHVNAMYWRQQSQINRDNAAPPPDPVVGGQPASDEGEEAPVDPTVDEEDDDETDDQD